MAIYLAILAGDLQDRTSSHEPYASRHENITDNWHEPGEQGL